MLDGPRYRRTSPGRYVPVGVPPTTIQRLVESAAHLPVGGALGGWCAAHLHGATRFDGLDRSLRPAPVVLCVPDALHRRATPGLRYVRQELADDEVVHVGGIPVTSPARTASDLARWATNLEEAVVDLDALLAAGVVQESALPLLADGLGARRGSRQARSALALARYGARSPGETRLRLTYVLGLGVPTPLLNPRVHDRLGRFLGIPDLLDRDAGLVLEYDGGTWRDSERPDGHLDPEQHREDNEREEWFERNGLLVLRATKADVARHRPGLVSRMGAARAEGLLLGPARWTWRVDPERYTIPPGRAR
nr:type IV toxin-antitoxin system AbiEi family antitoxin [Microlunatus antarcticus]